MIRQRRQMLQRFVARVMTLSLVFPGFAVFGYSAEKTEVMANFECQALSPSYLQFPRIPFLRRASALLRRSEAIYLPAKLDNLPIDDEISLLQILLSMLRRKNPADGRYKLPYIVVISDQHGTIDKFDELILDGIRQVVPQAIPVGFHLNADVSLPQQLANFGIDFERDVKGKIYFHNLGDFMDRGPFGVKVALRSMELVDLDISDYVVGNHDLWVFKNLMGFHLPFYKNYNFYGYTDIYGDVAAFHAQKLAEDPEHAADPKWWAARLAEYNQYHNERQKTVWKELDTRVNGLNADGKKIAGEGLYNKVSSSLHTAEQRKLWDRFRGNMFKTDIYTGVRAVGHMSEGWWEKLYQEFRSESENVKKEFGENSPPAQAWAEAIQIMQRDILPEIRRDFKAHVKDQGMWWWRVFEALNDQNYRTPEWWAKDWIFHAGWGSAVLKELNARRKGRLPPVDESNYLADETLIRITAFFRKHFNLYTRDIYQNVYMHSYLPVNEHGEFFFTYKNVDYRGKGSSEAPSVWQGLDLIAQDIRDPANSMSDIAEALGLVNSWYADETTQAKVPDVAAAINRFGPSALARANGFRRLFTGHLPFHEFHNKLSEELRGIIGSALIQNILFFVDHGMGEKFGGRGGAFHIHAFRGIFYRGWATIEAALDSLQSHAPTALQTGNGQTVLSENRPVSPVEFLKLWIRDLDDRLLHLTAYRLVNPINHSGVTLGGAA